MGNEPNKTNQEAEARTRAREFILSAIDEGRSAVEILDELTSFYDGDPTDLF